MLASFALFCVLCSICLFFSQELIKTFKRILSIQGASLVLPLALGSALVWSLHVWLLWVIYALRGLLDKVYVFLLNTSGFQRLGPKCALIFLLTLLSVVPIVVLEWHSQRKKEQAYPYPYLTSTLIWVVLVILFLIIDMN